MELRVLRYFLAVAREESISGAAEALHVTQPTLSRQMMELEEELGKTLFLRGKRKISLTEEGMFLRKRAQEIVTLVEKTESEFSAAEETISGDVHIGGGETDAMRLIFDYKNVRSWLDCLETVTTRPLPVSIAVAGIMRTMNRVRLWFPPRPVPSGRVHVGLGSTRYSRSVIRPWTPPRPVPALRGRIAFAIISQSRSIVCPKP